MASDAVPITADSVAPPASKPAAVPASSFNMTAAPSTSATTTTISTIDNAP